MTSRWHIDLVEQIDTLPVPWRRPRRRASAAPPRVQSGTVALVAALDLLMHRGSGPNSWIASFRHDPLAFLLDTAGEAIGITVWGPGGNHLYRSHAAERFGISRAQPATLERLTVQGRRLERRCLPFEWNGRDCVLEVISETAGE